MKKKLIMIKNKNRCSRVVGKIISLKLYKIVLNQMDEITEYFLLDESLSFLRADVIKNKLTLKIQEKYVNEKKLKIKNEESLWEWFFYELFLKFYKIICIWNVI